jgi:hypothetical protein
MKRILVCVVAVAGLTLGTAGQANASWSELGYSGYQPWWNIFAKRYKCLTPEEERLQKFWHDYYDALRNYYGALDHIDWVAYYKNHGVQISGPGGYPGCGRINYYPVFVQPGMQWAVPQGPTQGPPCQPGFGPGGMPMMGPGGAPGGMSSLPPGYPPMGGPGQFGYPMDPALAGR